MTTRFRVHRLQTLEQLAAYRRVLRRRAEEIVTKGGTPEYTPDAVLDDLAAHVRLWPRAGVWLAFAGRRLVALAAARVVPNKEGTTECLWTWAWSHDREASRLLHGLVEAWARTQGADGIAITRRTHLRAFRRLIELYGYQFHCAVFRRPLIPPQEGASHE